MKKIAVLLIMVVGLCLLVPAVSRAADDGKVIGNPDMICPVLGEPASKDISYEYDGKTYYFCCPACVNDFKADPEKYITKEKSTEE